MSAHVLKNGGRIAIVNRGEPAVRFLNAVADFNDENKSDFTTIALYTLPDQHSKYVRRADESYLLGDALEPDYSQLAEDGSPVMKSPYLDYARLRRALERTKANAVWVGWGFVSEHAAFVDMCDEMGIVFIGPSGDTMRKLGDKIGSKHLSEGAGVPVSPWSKGAVATVEDAAKWGDEIGYPLVVKATAGGGGRGIRKVFGPDEIKEAFESASSEALKAFGDGTVFMEKMLTDARHLEVQIVADKHGTVWPVGVRDCSVQRRHQKAIEEGPAAILSPAREKKLKEAAVNIAVASDYHNAGTAEFLYSADTGDFYFMEMNTRLQVEHPVTEVTTGCDLVKMQLNVAMGKKLEGKVPKTVGHAIEVRLNAEDPYNQFTPSPGRIKLFNIPGGPGVRVDSGVGADSEIPTAFDSMVAKIISYGRDREEALSRLQRVVKASTIVIENGTTNKSFLLSLLDSEKFRNNEVTTGWLDAEMAKGIKPDPRYRDAALICAAIELYNEKLHEERRTFFRTVSRGRPRKLPVAKMDEIELKLDGESYQMDVRLLEPEYYQICHNGEFFDVKLVRDGFASARLYYDERKYTCVISERQKDLQVEVEGHTYLVEQDSGGLVTCASPAVILAVHVEPGQEVNEGDPLVTMEAMKMEMHLAAPSSGVVSQVLVRRNEQVGAGDGLVIIEAAGDGSEKAVSDDEAVTFKYNSKPEAAAGVNAQLLREGRMFLMGFDVHSSSFESLCSRLPEAVERLSKTEEGKDRLMTTLQELFDLYFDIEFLFLKEHPATEDAFGSPEQNFFAFLQLLGTDKAHPHEEFLTYLDRALAYYDVTSDQESEELEEALIRIFYAHNNRKLKLELLTRLMVAFRDSGGFSEHEGLRNLLLAEIERGRDFSEDIHRLVTEFYYQVLARASYQNTVARLVSNTNELLEQLDQVENDESREALMDQIVACPNPLMKHLIDKAWEAPENLRCYYADMLLRRVQFQGNLGSFKRFEKNGVFCASAVHTVDRNTTLHLAFLAPMDNLDNVLAEAAKVLREQKDHEEVTLDIFMHNEQDLEDEGYMELLGGKMTGFPVFSLLSKVQIVISDNGSIGRCFLFEAGQGGYTEKRLYRGILGIQAERFGLERLEGFKTRRLPTASNVYLFHCEAEDNAEDQRLIAFCEIRTAPDEVSGGDFKYGILHRDLLMIRKAMNDWMATKPKTNFYWNQIILYIRPLLTVDQPTLLAFLREELTGFGQAGLEMVRVYALMSKPNGDVTHVQIESEFPGGMGLKFRISSPTSPQIKPLSPHEFKKALARRRGINYPYEVVRLLTDGYFHRGEFEEYELLPDKDGTYRSTSVKGRPEGENWHGMVYGVITNYTPKHPEGMKRVLLLSDGNYGLGCLSEPECRYALAAMELARDMNVPLEWFPISSGAKISMENGTENLDWTAKVLKEIIDFTQAGGEINIVVDAINVGAQSYWNAEATMMMHNKGCLIMTPRGCMVLTGKGALDYAGSVSAEDNFGIGGLHRIMHPNGQVQYPANNLLDACDKLFRYYEKTYVMPGESFPRAHVSADDDERNICETAYSFDLTPDFKRIGDIFDDASKKKPFDMRQLMAAVSDSDAHPLERWPGMLDAETTIVHDTTMGGICCTMIGIQSMPMKRRSEIPNDGPDSWSGGTLFPMSSKKLARALNSASGRRPVVILANLSGFDGSPESLRRLQLEYGAEIGRAVVNFDGPILFTVVSRYHGGAYVVFSNVLNDNMHVMALEGTYASVIGGAPAAAVVFPRQVRKRTLADPRLQELQAKIDKATAKKRTELRLQYNDLHQEIFTEKQGEVAAEFEGVHTVKRALEVGSLHEILEPTKLRPRLIELLREKTGGNSDGEK